MPQKPFPSQSKIMIAEAKQEDFNQLADFLNQNNKIHRHLDWFTVLDWLGSHPFLLERMGNEIVAVLCATPENDKAAWVRVFGVRENLPLQEYWQRLIPRAIDKLSEMNISHLASLSLHPWFKELLVDYGFINQQNIIVLEWKGNLPKRKHHNTDVQIRRMVITDLPEVECIDRLAFPSLWQNSIDALTKAFKQTGISTVALLNGKIVGYQISTSMTVYGHLARLAVHPEFQRKGIAFILVYDLLRRFEKREFWRITVNTQSNNVPSLNLYKKFHFFQTNEIIPVYEFNL